MTKLSTFPTAHPNRRAALHFLGGTLAAGVLAHAATPAALPRPRSPFEAAGALYLQRYPEEADATALRRRLFGDGKPSSDAASRRLVVERSADDFASRDVVWIGGWILARSEARLFALAFLESPP